MNKPTPETDANQVDAIKLYTSLNARIQCHLNFARKLERERDEARGNLEGLQIQHDIGNTAICLKIERQEAELTQLHKVCDELAKQLEEVPKVDVSNDASFVYKVRSSDWAFWYSDYRVKALSTYSQLPHVKAKGNKE